MMRATVAFLIIFGGGFSCRALMVPSRETLRTLTMMPKTITNTRTISSSSSLPVSSSTSFETFTTITEVNASRYRPSKSRSRSTRSRSSRIYKKLFIENTRKTTNVCSLQMTSHSHRIRTGTKLVAILCCSAAIAHYKTGTKRNIAASIIASICANTIRKLSTRKRYIPGVRVRVSAPASMSIPTEVDQAKKTKTTTNVTSTIWDDEERIEKALAKSKRSNDWVDQSMTQIEEKSKRIAHEKAQKMAKLEKMRKEKAKEWVKATMHRQSLEIEQARRGRREETRGKKWAEDVIRNNEE